LGRLYVSSDPILKIDRVVSILSEKLNNLLFLFTRLTRVGDIDPQ